MKYIPSLTDQAWVNDGSKMLNHILSYYILTDNGQSIAFNTRLVSLPYTYFRYINDPEEMRSAVKLDLEKLLNAYFEGVEVSTETRELSPSRFGILMSATVTDNTGKRLSMSKISEMSNDGLRRVMDISNMGEGLRVLNSL